MLKKLLYFSIILLIAMLFLNITYATDIVSRFNNTTNNETSNEGTVTNTNVIDNTVYSSNTDDAQIAAQDLVTDYEQAATTTTEDYESETELSISNMINIILIVVGIVLVLLGIAIIIKLN